MSDERQVVDRAKLKRMRPDRIADATKDGGFELLFTGVVPTAWREVDADQWGKVVSNVTADEIVEARAAGLLDPRAETADDKPTPQPSADQDAGDTPVIGTKGWLRTASPAEISAALTRGDLDTLLAGTRPQQ